MHNATNNPFWSYSLTQYSQPECEAFCLAAQNQYAIDVNLILFGVWLANQGKRLDLTRLPKPITLHQQHIIQPLRELRIALKSASELDSQIQHLRNHLKKVELQAEQVEQWWLYSYGLTLDRCDDTKSEKAITALAMENLFDVFDSGSGERGEKQDWVEAAIRCFYPN